MPLTWFQRLLIAIPYLLYVFLIFRSKPEDIATWGLWLLGMLLFSGLTSLIGFVIYSITRGKVSITGGFILTHWLILDLIVVLVIYYRFFDHREDSYSSMNKNNGEQEWHYQEGTTMALMERSAAHYAQNEVLHNRRHYRYFQTLRPAKDYPGYYFAHYYYNEGKPEDTAGITAIRMQLDTIGNIATASTIKLAGNSVLQDDFYRRIKFNRAINQVTEEAGKFPQGGTSSMDSATRNDIGLIDDSISIE